VRPYSYRADAEELAQALRQVSLDVAPAARRLQDATVWLPTQGGRPLPSSPIIAPPPGAGGALALAPWGIGAFALSPEEAVPFLCLCMGRRTLAPGVMVGADLAYWAEALRYAGSLVARQQYLPGLSGDGTTYLAVWEPVWAGGDAAHLAALARRMPPVARALGPPGVSAPPETPALLVLQHFLAAAVDYLVRSSAQPGSPPGERRKGHAFPSIHDAWLAALRTPHGMVAGDPGELAWLAAQVRKWRRPIAVAAASPFRLCFRLEEPDELGEGTAKQPEAPAEQWYVRYLLQAHDDLSLLVPLEETWKPRGRKASILGGHGPRLREYTLSSLGQAAGICPEVAASLEGAAPSGYSLDTAGAHRFLAEQAAALEQGGFGVMLPAWWARRGTKARLALRAKVKSPRLQVGSGLSLDAVAQVDWEVALGGEPLTPRELETLAEMKTPLVRVRGQWVEVNAAEIRAAADFWRKHRSTEAEVRDLVRMALGAPRDGGAPLEIDGVAASGWVGALLAQLEGRAAFEELPAPGDFIGTLRPYQVRGYSWLAFLRRWGLGACLADDMGLGKTVQALALLQRDWDAGNRQPVLLVCPTSVVANWRKEAARFTPTLPVLIHHGVERKRWEAFQREAERHALVICSYALLQRDIDFLRDVAWAGVILDEAQNIKNPETRQSHAARSVRAGYRVALTGTPVENHVGDLWSLMEFLNPGLLGSQTEFRRRFLIPIQAERDPHALERLRRLTGPFILRRLKTDRSIIRDLPDKTEMKVFCPLTKEQASLYAAVLKETEAALQATEGIERRGMILGLLSKLKQVCNHPAQFLGDNSSLPGRSGKLARLTEMLEEVLEVGDRVLVFSQFAEMGALLRRYLQETFGREVLFLHGGVPRRQRDAMVERFEQDAGPAVFLLSLKAGGTGLNLTRANHVFHFDRWWNPAVEDQATDRAFRIGQTRNVQVHKFVCAGTFEEKIDEMIERKKAVAEHVVGTGEGWLTELSNEELREVLTLREDAVEV
jgi:SNF2 family DNA or RNA helicase